MQQMMMQAQKLQRELNKAMAELETKEFTLTKGGAITITLLGSHEVKSIQIKEDFINTDNKEMIEDLIVLTINEIIQMIETARGDINEKITGRRTGLGV
jgi:hypothetical protein